MAGSSPASPGWIDRLNPCISRHSAVWEPPATLTGDSNMGLVMVEIDMHHLRPVGPPGRKHWEVQKVVPKEPSTLRQTLGKSTLTYSTRVPCGQGRDAEAALIRDAMLPQLEARIEAVLKDMEPVYHHHIGIGRRGQINLLPG